MYWRKASPLRLQFFTLFGGALINLLHDWIYGPQIGGSHTCSGSVWSITWISLVNHVNNSLIIAGQIIPIEQRTPAGWHFLFCDSVHGFSENVFHWNRLLPVNWDDPLTLWVQKVQEAFRWTEKLTVETCARAKAPIPLPVIHLWYFGTGRSSSVRRLFAFLAKHLLWECCNLLWRD